MKKVISIILCTSVLTFCACVQEKEKGINEQAVQIGNNQEENTNVTQSMEIDHKQGIEEEKLLDGAVYRSGNKYWNEVVEWDEKNLRTGLDRPMEPLLNTDSKIYNKEELKEYPQNILYLAKNEIYAKHGYIFKNTELQNYFLGQVWYVPEKQKTEFSDDVFNEYEKSNLELLASLLKEE
ncbi:MAG: YARHG domain-containing protein [bacterium]|nr:YARHG domain-containing protein [bacterium]